MVHSPAFKILSEFLLLELDANRIRAGERLPLRLDTCDLVALARRVAEEARAMHGDRFAVDADEQASRGIWSEDELHRALWNLVANAVT